MAIAANKGIAKIDYYYDKSIKPAHLVRGLYCNCLKANPFRTDLYWLSTPEKNYQIF